MSGNLVEQLTLSTDGTLVPDEQGVARRRWRYDDRGQPARYEFDRFGREVVRRFYDSAGHLTLHPLSGRASTETAYDVAGRIVRVACFDTQHRPINRRDLGFAVQTVTYSASGIEIERRCERVGGARVQACPEVPN